jgi:hypothetical protein
MMLLVVAAITIVLYFCGGLIERYSDRPWDAEVEMSRKSPFGRWRL